MPGETRGCPEQIPDFSRKLRVKSGAPALFGVRAYFAKTRTRTYQEESFFVGCGLSAVAAGGGPNFAVTVKTLCVFVSRAMVRAPGSVFTFSTTLNFCGESSFTTVSTPSPQEANASPVSSS